MRYLIFILFLLPVFCNAQNSGLVIKTGATNQATIQKGATGADSITLMGVMDTARGKAYLATGANSLRLIGRVVLNSSDSTLYLYNGLGWVRVGTGGTAIDTTGLSDRITYNLTRIDGLSDTALLNTDTLEAHTAWLNSIEGQIAAIPTANDFQTVLDNGNTSNKDFIVERSSYTGTTRIGDGISSFAPPNPSRVSFYVTSKTQGQGAGSGIGYGIQSVAEYIDSVGFPSSTTLIGVKGTATASSSTSSGGLNEHDFVLNAAGANMAGLIGESFTRDSATTTSSAGIVASTDAFEQSHIRFGVNFLSIGTKRRTGTTIDSFAGLYLQQRGQVHQSGTLGSNYGIFVDSMVGGNTNYGIWFKSNPSDGSIATENGADFSIKTGIGAATKIHGPEYVYDTARLLGEVYINNLPTVYTNNMLHVNSSGRMSKSQAPFSNTYTPSKTNVTNVTGSITYLSSYTRVGNVITVYGRIDIQPTVAASTQTQIDMALPFASDLTLDYDLAGTAVSDFGPGYSIRIKAETTSNQASFVFKAETTTMHSYSYQFSYVIK